MSKGSFPKKGASFESVLALEVILSKLYLKKKKITHIFLRIFAKKNIHLGFGYFLRFTPVKTAQQSWTKSESLCYLVVITNAILVNVYRQFMTNKKV